MSARIDPGIREAVVALNAAGFKTTSSCEGGKHHDFPAPTIRIKPRSPQPQPLIAEQSRLAELLRRLGVAGCSVKIVWHVNVKHTEVPYFEVEWWSANVPDIQFEEPA